MLWLPTSSSRIVFDSHEILVEKSRCSHEEPLRGLVTYNLRYGNTVGSSYLPVKHSQGSGCASCPYQNRAKRTTQCMSYALLLHYHFVLSLFQQQYGTCLEKRHTIHRLNNRSAAMRGCSRLKP